MHNYQAVCQLWSGEMDEVAAPRYEAAMKAWVPDPSKPKEKAPKMMTFMNDAGREFLKTANPEQKAAVEAHRDEDKQRKLERNARKLTVEEEEEVVVEENGEQVEASTDTLGTGEVIDPLVAAAKKAEKIRIKKARDIQM